MFNYWNMKPVCQSHSAVLLNTIIMNSRRENCDESNVSVLILEWFQCCVHVNEADPHLQTGTFLLTFPKQHCVNNIAQAQCAFVTLCRLKTQNFDESERCKLQSNLVLATSAVEDICTRPAVAELCFDWAAGPLKCLYQHGSLLSLCL